MKRSPSLCFILLLMGVLFAREARAEDYTRWNLPKGALARLGKGEISSEDRAVVHSPDSTRMAVASNLGIWLYDARTGSEIALLEDYWRGVYDDVRTLSFSPDGRTLASGRRYRLFQE